jgi:putative MATE family efflux protein
MQHHSRDLTTGSIVGALAAMALPIMATSFTQMGYSMMNMFWVGNLGSRAVASIGTASFFTWLGVSLFVLVKVGAEVSISQAIGRKDHRDAVRYASSALVLIVILASLYTAVLHFFPDKLISFFAMNDQEVVRNSEAYLATISLALPFSLSAPVFSGIYNGTGNSRTPFMVNTAGLLINFVLDPLFIFGYGPVPAFGIQGAAYATICAQFLVSCVFIGLFVSKYRPLQDFSFKTKASFSHLRRIAQIGIPPALHSALFAMIAIVIGRIIAGWGPIPIAVQKVGSEIEAISWATAGGFSTALAAFVGQNFGAKKWDRIVKSYLIAMLMMMSLGLATSCLLIWAAKPIFSIFITDNVTLPYGVTYLKILGYSQFFMCIEITTAGAFNGLSQSGRPAIIGILFNLMRIPMALILSSPHLLGLNGIWWAISISSMFKGTVLVGWYVYTLYKHPFLPFPFWKIDKKTPSSLELLHPEKASVTSGLS